MIADPPVATRSATAPIAAGQVVRAVDPVPQLAAQLADATRIASELAAMAELVRRVGSTTSVDAACRCVADELGHHLQAAYVAVGLCRRLPSDDAKAAAGTGSRAAEVCRLTALSGHPVVDATSAICRAAEAVLQESVARASASVWPPTDGGNRHALLAHQHFAIQYQAAGIAAVPMHDSRGRTVGAMFAAFARSPGADEAVSTYRRAKEADSIDDLRQRVDSAARFLSATERSLATTLTLIARSTASPLHALTHRVRTSLTTRRARTFSVAAGILLATLLLPVQYNVSGVSELQPAARRFVAAPFDGPLLECFVEPGDYVDADQLLARMDGREIQWELAGIRADLNRANNERKSKLADHEFGEAEIARLEVRRLENRSELLAHRDSNLEIRSPVTGIVISGEHKHAEGVPLETGQALFEIASLDRMVIEVAVPEEDIRWTQAGQPLTLVLHAMPSASITATVQRIHPGAELRDNENVFIAEAEIDNSILQLRPGMRGHASIATGRHSLGWNLLHKPVGRIVAWLGW